MLIKISCNPYSVGMTTFYPNFQKCFEIRRRKDQRNCKKTHTRYRFWYLFLKKSSHRETTEDKIYSGNLVEAHDSNRQAKSKSKEQASPGKMAKKIGSNAQKSKIKKISKIKHRSMRELRIIQCRTNWEMVWKVVSLTQISEKFPKIRRKNSRKINFL